jgi:hypothetical protein
MSYVGIEDTGAGFDVSFFETTPGGVFPGTTIASGLSYTDWHQVDIYIEFVDGLKVDLSGNDIVTVQVDGITVHTGTTWESFFAENPGSFQSPIAVDALLFRASGGLVIPERLERLGDGFFFDNVVADNAQLVTDIEGPIVSEVEAIPNPISINDTGDITLIALVDDFATGDSDIDSAEYSPDGGTTWYPMDAADTAFDDPTELATASFTLGDLSITETGIYQICVRGFDALGNESNTACTMLVVYDPSAGFVTGGGWIDSPAGAFVGPSAFGTVWDQDFSVGTEGWFDPITAVGNGTARVEGGAFSRFDGYHDTWNGTWVAEVDVYLDPTWAVGQGFDYSVAANGSDGNHQRDYIFHVGVVAGSGLLVNGSNNADFTTNPYKLLNDNGGVYHEVTQAGWYTLQHVFYDAGGYLAVDLNLLDSGSNVLWTAIRENVADTIPGEVGGNRYSWFTHIDVSGGILIDNHQRFANAPTFPTGKANFGFMSKYKKGKSVPDGSTEFVYNTGGINFHSSTYDWLVVNQNGQNAQFKGDGTINGAADYGFMIWGYDGTKSGDADTFRIKIWDKLDGDAVVYDNGTDQEIGGGNILVHTSNKK